jgi:NTE family protein
VLGAGGVLGAAWTVGTLCALEQATEGLDVRRMDVIVGTSAGSVIAALLGAGVRPDEMRDQQLGLPVETGPLAGLAFDHNRATGGPLPPRPRARPGSRRLLVRTVTHPRSVTPMAALAAVLPVGRGTLPGVSGLVDAVTPAGGWSPHPGLWIVAMDFDNGRRVPFGRRGEPDANLADAVLASCSIPGWYSPVEIHGRRYVDGGACSATSVDLLAGLGLDEVYVLAPMASFEYDRPDSFGGRLERRFRRRMTMRMMREKTRVAAGGTSVTVLAPGRDDLVAMGTNLMDPRRRPRVLETALRTSAQQLLRAG